MSEIASLNEAEMQVLETGCHGSGEYPCLEHYLTKEDRLVIVGAGRGEVIPKGTRQGGEMLDAVQSVIAVRVKAARREALAEAADAWQRGEWANAPRRADPVVERIANGQYVTEWLRARAAGEGGEDRG